MSPVMHAQLHRYWVLSSEGAHTIEYSKLKWNDKNSVALTSKIISWVALVLYSFFQILGTNVPSSDTGALHCFSLRLGEKEKKPVSIFIIYSLRYSQLRVKTTWLLIWKTIQMHTNKFYCTKFCVFHSILKQVLTLIVFKFCLCSTSYFFSTVFKIFYFLKATTKVEQRYIFSVSLTQAILPR